ncbi:MAG TPA: response regulator [Candidatus Hydrogenedentes bacterium]|nr:response regulator [Candidatus Hydrogenedentota bacterium]HPC17398.1 response regulator [Candidatus Hydrogenedentota bacterium]HRT20825.1 response regulator [Candidatus Hydrogenedentota bacterium]HRT66094.1 response regulator [Candidatus Hydrogenedentota bacterium]
MPSLLVISGSGSLIAELRPIVEPCGWTIQPGHPDTVPFHAADAVLFDLQTPIAGVLRHIENISTAAPCMPLVFLGDDITVAPEWGEGLRYYVSPRLLSDLEHVLISLSYGFPADDAEAAELAADHAVPRVLIVDDSMQLAALMARALRSMERYDVRVVNTGFEAISLLPAFRPDVAIIDIVLHDMDGREICTFIHNHPDLGHTKIIGVSGYMSAERLENDHVPLHAFIAKPFRMKEILDQVAAFLA